MNSKHFLFSVSYNLSCNDSRYSLSSGFNYKIIHLSILALLFMVVSCSLSSIWNMSILAISIMCPFLRYGADISIKSSPIYVCNWFISTWFKSKAEIILRTNRSRFCNMDQENPKWKSKLNVIMKHCGLTAKHCV